MMYRVFKRLFITVHMAILSLLVMLLNGVPLVAAAQGEPVPAVGEIVVDSFDCDTGRLNFHVPVTDLPHDPIDDGSLAYSISPSYEQGNADYPWRGFNVEAQDSPYTGDVHLSVTVATSGADSYSPDGAQGPITSIEIFVGVGYDGGPGPSDTSSLTYPADCGESDTDSVPAPSAEGDGEDTATGDTAAAETATNDTAVEDTVAETNTDEGVNGDATTGDGTNTETDVADDGGDTTADETTNTALDIADAGEADTGGTTEAEVTTGTNADGVTALPSTGAGAAVRDPAHILLVTFLSGSALLCSLAALRIRHLS